MNEYKFDLHETPLREHRLFAYASSDDELLAASAKKLILLFEERFLGEYCWRASEGRNRMRYNRLKGFRGDFYWRNGTLRFCVRTPELPFFGEEASRLCTCMPIVYSSVCHQSGITPFRYFLSGREYREAEIPGEYAKGFAVLTQLKSGFIPERITIDQFM